MGRQKYEHLPPSPGHYSAATEKQNNVIGTKISQARRNAGLSLSEFSQILKEYGLSIGRQGLGKWESGDAVPNGYQLLAVCHALHIQNGLSYFTSSHRPVLNQQGQQKLRDYQEDLIASGRYTPEQPEITYIKMPVSILPASAGTGTFLEEESFEWMAFPSTQIPPKADFGVYVSGDSMEPVFHDKQLVWVQRCQRLTPGEVGLFLYDGEGYIKIYGEQSPSDDICYDTADDTCHMQPVLISYNPAYPPKAVSPQLSFSIAGRILSVEP